MSSGTPRKKHNTLDAKSPTPAEWSFGQPSDRSFLLSGLMRCARCGSKYTIVTRKYGCAGRKRFTCDQAVFLKRQDCETEVVSGLLRHLEQSQSLERCWSKAKQIYVADKAVSQQVDKAEEERISRLNKKLARLVQAVEEGAGFSQVRDRANEIQQQISTTQDELDRIRRLKATHEEFVFRPDWVREALRHLLSDSKSPAARVAFRSLVKEIAVIDLGDKTALDIKLATTA